MKRYELKMTEEITEGEGLKQKVVSTTLLTLSTEDAEMAAASLHAIADVLSNDPMEHMFDDYISKLIAGGGE
jgi:hypothetical protein